MIPRPRHARAVLFASLSLIVFGCERVVPTAPGESPSPVAGADTVFKGGGTRPDSTRGDRSVTVLLPAAISFIRRMPEMGIIDGGGGAPGEAGSGDAQSTYFRTTDANREFRRGFAEFAFPRLHGRIVKATLVLRESRAWIADPRPPDVHEVSSYTDVDFIVTAADFDRATTPLATFQTDVNEDQGTFRFDVTDLVRAHGAGLGFRVKLAVDPVETGFVPLGSAFSGSSTPPGFVLEVETTAHIPS